MTPSQQRDSVLGRLLENIRTTRGNHISSGIVGTHYVFQTLMESDQNQVAYDMLIQEDFPSWGHMLRSGGTTVWEAWDGAGSRNHPALGSVDAWLYQALGGIRLDPDVPAFERLIIRPAMVGDLEWVQCAHESLRGRIESRWQRADDKLRMELTIPINTTATVYVPAAEATTVTESGRPAATADGVKLLRTEPGVVLFEVGSGDYVFEAIVSPATP